MARTLPRPTAVWLLVAAAALCAGCKETVVEPGETGAPGERGEQGPVPNSTVLSRNQELPGLTATVLGLSGGSGPRGAFVPGDRFKVRFFVARRSDGKRLPIRELSAGYALVSGPTDHYQRVFSLRSDVLTRSVLDEEDPDSLVYTYTFNTPFPETYLAPQNDTPDLTEGEWTGQPIKDGTYTLGMHFWKNYTVDGVVHRDPANLTRDFLVGAATTIEPHEVVKTENCNQCHIRLNCHGGLRYDVKMCSMCHYEGTEDSLDRSITPGLTADFKVLIHKLHNGAHLPSVVGVSTDAQGNRDYAAAPKPFTIYEEFADHFRAEQGGALRDFSHVLFPAMPAATIAMPKNQGYSALSADAKKKDDQIRKGIVACDACHGDPDGDGPLTPPLQGAEAMTNPSRAACGSCHDDVDWTKPYNKNGQTQPPQADDSKCAGCHAASGTPLSVEDAHRHPLSDPALNPTLKFEVLSVTEAGAHNGNGAIDPGERVSVSFDLHGADGGQVPISTLSSLFLVINGPTTNRNLVHYVSIPVALVAGTQAPYTINVPAFVPLEPLGASSPGTSGESWNTSRAPILAVTGADTKVFVRTAESAATTLSAPAAAAQNYVDVVDAAAAGIARDKIIAIRNADGGGEEYAVVQWVENNTRVWLSAAGDTKYGPALRFGHAAGGEVRRVTLAAKQPQPNPDGGASDYALLADAGTITEQADRMNPAADAGVVIASYWSDFVVPAIYPATLADGPDLDETHGKWVGKPLVSGTYTLGMWGYRTITVNQHGETNRYSAGAIAGTRDFLVGDATALVPYSLLTPANGATCDNCHRELEFHGGQRRGLQTCLLCHGNAGIGDRPRYVAPNAPETPGATADFRTMLHKLHMGSGLSNPAAYRLVGFGEPTLYPNNFEVHDFADVMFPPAGRVKHCKKCHGDKNTAWQQPMERNHPTAQTSPVRAWRSVCGSCHDSSAAAAHLALETTAQGGEACAVCHGPNRDQAVDAVHKARTTW